MSKNKVTPAASVIAFGYSLDEARSAARSAATKWSHVYEAAADMIKEVPSRSLAAQLAAAGIECNKDTVGFYADAAPWAYLMRPSGEVSMFEAAAVMADQASTLLPHECVSYGRNRGGLTIEEVRQVIADYNDKSLEIAGDDDSLSDDEKVAKIVGELSKAIRNLRTKAKAKRTPQPPEIDDQGDDQADDQTDDQDAEDSAPAGDRAANLISAIVGPMNALTEAIRSGEIQLDEHQKHSLNAHWSELIKASRATAEAAA